MLLNISTRARVETGDHVLIGGFVIRGNAPKRIIARGLGPSLGASGVSNTLQDPVLRLFSGPTVIAANDNWAESDPATIAASGFQPQDGRESAVVATLDPGAYTVILSGAQNGQGVALVEVYDLDSTSPTTLVNISTRGVVRAGDNVMIGGLVVSGASAGQFVVRAVGPSLAAQGIPDPLPNPVLQLHDINGNMIGFNDDWDQSPPGELQSMGLAPSSELEAAIVSTLPPGNYTAIVRSISPSTSGVALVEIYRP
ncbi:MAG TPA: hypothetical protein VF683_01735 [Chthoniobacterales bacterium]